MVAIASTNSNQVKIYSLIDYSLIISQQISYSGVGSLSWKSNNQVLFITPLSVVCLI
jgi:hypothetical protein